MSSRISDLYATGCVVWYKHQGWPWWPSKVVEVIHPGDEGEKEAIKIQCFKTRDEYLLVESTKSRNSLKSFVHEGVEDLVIRAKKSCHKRKSVYADYCEALELAVDYTREQTGDPEFSLGIDWDADVSTLSQKKATPAKMYTPRQAKRSSMHFSMATDGEGTKKQPKPVATTSSTCASTCKKDRTGHVVDTSGGVPMLADAPKDANKVMSEDITSSKRKRTRPMLSTGGDGRTAAKRLKTNADDPLSEKKEKGEGKGVKDVAPTDLDKKETKSVSQPLGHSSLQNTLEGDNREVKCGTANVNSKGAPSQRGKPSEADGGCAGESLSYTVQGTGSGTVSKEGSQQDYLKNLPRHERRRIEQEIRRKRKPALTVANIRRAVQGLEWRRLGRVLRIPDSILDEIYKEHTTDDQREAAVIHYWMLHDPLASWRRLVDNLHWYDKDDHANRISRYAEKLTDSSLTHLNVSTVLNSVSVEGMERCLWIPLNLRRKIADQSESEEERRNRLVDWWLKTSPYASWQWLSGWSHQWGEKSAVSAAKRYIQRAPELTLTEENLTSLLEGVKKLDGAAGVTNSLHIPYFKRSEIRRQYSSITQRRQEYCQCWLTYHPSPSWLVVANALYVSGEHGALEVLQKFYLKGTSESRRLLQDALKYGSLQAYLSKMLLFGSAGVGKTCTKDVVAGFTPPEIRQSTPLATRPVTLYQLDASKEIWKTFTSDNRMRFCAGIAKSLRPEEQEALLEADWWTDFDESSGASNIHTATHLQEMPELKYADRSATPDSQPFREHPIAGFSASDIQPLSTIDTKVAEVISSVFDKLFQLMDECPEGDYRIMSILHKLMIVDSGGQPQFHEVLPIFLRKMSLYTFVFKLPDDLSSYPPVEYFEKGKRVGKSYKSKHTTEQLFRHLLRSVHTHRSKGDREKIKARILLIGTHSDQLDSHKPIEEKNRRFSEILLPEFKEYVQYYDIATEQIVFPMNAKCPGNAEKAMAGKIRSVVTKECLPDPKDLPLQWLGLEIMLEEITRHLGRELLTKSECFYIATKLHFDESTLEAALMYLDELSLIFYYPKILPELVFTNPQVLLDKISELVKVHFDLMHEADSFLSCTVGDMWQEFFHYAFVTVDFLSQPQFDKHYVPGLFEPKHLVVLCKKLLIFATVADNKLFVPCLLQMLDDASVSELREPFQSAAAPLVLKFPHGGPRLGLFCALMSYLTSPDLKPSPWTLKTKPNSISPDCLFRNCIQLVLNHAPCTIMLVDAFTHFEIHILATKNICRDECPKIYQTILTGCQKAALTLQYTNSKPEPAFLCPCGSGGIHLANTGDKYWTCSLKHGVGGDISACHQIWFEEESSGKPSGCSPELRDLMIELKTVDWYEVGIQLNVPAHQLKTIRRENPTESMKMAEILQYWLDNETATWDKLIDALERIGGYGNIVASLRSKYIH